jgi:glycosyltransferase involved in cell wall biosynthesis
LGWLSVLFLLSHMLDKTTLRTEQKIMNDKPTISVVTPNYNHGRFITETIRSVARQVYQPIEHIIVDDGSTDDSREVIAALAREYPLVKLVVSERNRGAAAAMHVGVQAASGDFIMYLGADDVLPPRSLSRFHDVVQNHPDAALICGDIAFVNEQTGHSWVRRGLNLPAPTYISPENLIAQQRRGLNVINGGAAVVRRDVILEAEMNDISLRWYLDFTYYNAIAYRHGVHYIPEVLHRFRVTGKNYSSGSSIWTLQEPALTRLFEVLNSRRFRDIHEKFRRSAILGIAPHILRYMFKHRSARSFLTVALVKNVALSSGYRKFRALIPQRARDAFVRLRT